MKQMMLILCHMVLNAMLLIFSRAHAAEAALVQLESAPQLLGHFQRLRALENNEPVSAVRGDRIRGYLVKPEGAGPFPAVVVLHGCSGFRESFKSAPAKDAWVSRLIDWGYVVLAIDSFATRGIEQACTAADLARTSPILPRELDAFGGLLFLSRLPYVSRDRIALMGFSQGGEVALLATAARPFALFDNPESLRFVAAIAFYPPCAGVDGAIAVPTLILSGELDDWAPAKDCERMIARWNGASAQFRHVVFSGAYHDFDISTLSLGMEMFGHHLQYNDSALQRSVGLVRDFLTQNLQR